MNAKLPKSSFEVKLGENLGVFEMDEQRLDHWDWKFIIPEECIERLIINHALLLFSKDL